MTCNCDLSWNVFMMLVQVLNLLSKLLQYYQTALISMVSCQKGPTRHAYAWQIGPFWQDTIDMMLQYYQAGLISCHPSFHTKFTTQWSCPLCGMYVFVYKNRMYCYTSWFMIHFCLSGFSLPSFSILGYHFVLAWIWKISDFPSSISCWWLTKTFVRNLVNYWLNFPLVMP